MTDPDLGIPDLRSVQKGKVRSHFLYPDLGIPDLRFAAPVGVPTNRRQFEMHSKNSALNSHV